MMRAGAAWAVLCASVIVLEIVGLQEAFAVVVDASKIEAMNPIVPENVAILNAACEPKLSFQPYHGFTMPEGIVPQRRYPSAPSSSSSLDHKINAAIHQNIINRMVWLAPKHKRDADFLDDRWGLSVIPEGVCNFGERPDWAFRLWSWIYPVARTSIFEKLSEVGGFYDNVDARPLGCKGQVGRSFARVCTLLSCESRIGRIVHALPHVAKLDEEQTSLSNSNRDKAESKEAGRVFKQPGPPPAWFAFGLLFLALAIGGGVTYLISRWLGIWPTHE